MKAIQDEFAGRRDVSRQRIYQIRHARDRICHLCPELAVNATHCAVHAVEARELQRKRVGSVRRNWNAASYVFGKAVTA